MQRQSCHTRQTYDYSHSATEGQSLHSTQTACYFEDTPSQEASELQPQNQHLKRFALANKTCNHRQQDKHFVHDRSNVQNTLFRELGNIPLNECQTTTSLPPGGTKQANSKCFEYPTRRSHTKKLKNSDNPSQCSFQIPMLASRDCSVRPHVILEDGKSKTSKQPYTTKTVHSAPPVLSLSPQVVEINLTECTTCRCICEAH